MACQIIGEANERINFSLIFHLEERISCRTEKDRLHGRFLLCFISVDCSTGITVSDLNCDSAYKAQVILSRSRPCALLIRCDE